MYRIRVIKEIPKIKYTTYGFAIKPKKISCQVFQWPNGSFSLFVKKPTKHWGRYCEGILIGHYLKLNDAKKYAVKWLQKNNGN